MSSPKVCDVLVIGGGIAGWTAGLRAMEHGVDVLVTEKSPHEYGDGNGLMATGVFGTAGRSPESDPTELYQQVMKEGVAFPPLAKAWARNCSRSLNWLRQWGIEVVEVQPRRFRLEPNSSISRSPVYMRDVGLNVLRKLRAPFVEQGGRYAGNLEATRLLFDESQKIAGVVATSGRDIVEIRSKATILATGGFSANKELVATYIGIHAGDCKLRGSSSDTGDGLRMALEIGAKAVNLSYFYGHLISLKALSDDRFWPYPRVDPLVDAGILVNRSGVRFVDEGRGDVAVANEVARTDDVTGACLIFDKETWESAKDEPEPMFPYPPRANPWLMENDGYLYRHESVEGLARALAIDGTNLYRTVEGFNQALESGRAEDLPVPRTGNTRPLRSPFYGLKVVPGITFTMGGALIDGQAQVLDQGEEPIKGLYAAGDVIGGLMGGYHGGYTGGLSQAVVTGIMAGENAANFTTLPS